MNFDTIILDSDSYKYSQFLQYPKNTTNVFSYIEARGYSWGVDKHVFFGLQAFIKQYLLTPITQEDIDFAEEIITAHGEPFNREGWQYILDTYNGKLPVVIRAVPEGTVLKTHNVLVTIEATDPKCFWLTSFLETALLRAIWYPTTVATNSYVSKQIILNFLEKTGDPSSIDFKLHDFGARGVSSKESAGLGGMGHLLNFLGTDTVTALLYARKFYNADMAGFSIPAMEHSTVTSWGRENEVESYRNMLRTFGREGTILACVSDSYDIYNACELWGTVLKDEVIKSGATVVVRPDSGVPEEVVLKCVEILGKNFGYTKNSKGYNVLNNVRVIQGDGINQETIRKILENLVKHGWSADNVAFGQGGALLQQVNRDTLKFAMKCSAALIDGTWVDVYKDPITDQGKKSKKGRLDLFKDEDGNFFSGREDWMPSQLRTVYKNGELLIDENWETIKARVK